MAEENTEGGLIMFLLTQKEYEGRVLFKVRNLKQAATAPVSLSGFFMSEIHVGSAENTIPARGIILPVLFPVSSSRHHAMVCGANNQAFRKGETR